MDLKRKIADVVLLCLTAVRDVFFFLSGYRCGIAVFGPKMKAMDVFAVWTKYEACAPMNGHTACTVPRACDVFETGDGEQLGGFHKSNACKSCRHWLNKVRSIDKAVCFRGWTVLPSMFLVYQVKSGKLCQTDVMCPGHLRSYSCLARSSAPAGRHFKPFAATEVDPLQFQDF